MRALLKSRSLLPPVLSPRLLVIAGVALAGCLPGARGTAPSPPVTPGEWAMVMDALVDSTSELVVARSTVSEAVGVMRRLRAGFPAVQDVAGPSAVAEEDRFATHLLYFVPRELCDSGSVDSIRTVRFPGTWRTGNRTFDSVTAAVGGASGYHLQCSWRAPELTVRYAEPVNVRALARQVPPTPGYSVFEEIVFGGGDRLAIFAGRLAWTIVLSRGWGDCVAGCNYRHTWTFRYVRSTSEIVLVSESGPPVPERSG